MLETEEVLVETESATTELTEAVMTARIEEFLNRG